MKKYIILGFALFHITNNFASSQPESSESNETKADLQRRIQQLTKELSDAKAKNLTLRTTKEELSQTKNIIVQMVDDHRNAITKSDDLKKEKEELEEALKLTQEKNAELIKVGDENLSKHNQALQEQYAQTQKARYATEEAQKQLQDQAAQHQKALSDKDQQHEQELRNRTILTVVATVVVVGGLGLFGYSQVPNITHFCNTQYNRGINAIGNNVKSLHPVRLIT